MARVTALKAQAANANRVNVFLDGEYAFSLHVDLAVDLRTDQELSAAEIDALRGQDAREQAYARALHYLSFRPRSAREVERYLLDKGVAEDDVAALLARLRAAELVDDRVFARWWVGARETGRPKGAWALRSELRLKGVSDDDIDAAVAELDESASALSAAERRAEQLAHLDQDTFQRRLLAFLMRRGFGYAVARETVDRLWDEHGARSQAQTR